MSDIDPGFTSPDEQRDYWPFARLVLIVALVVVGGRWLYHNVPLPFVDPSPFLARRQARNDRVVDFYLDALRSHHRATERYPHSLIDAVRPTRVPGGIAGGVPLRDAWGHPLRYFSDGEMFLLVSVGRDGEPETDDYHLLRAEGVRRDVCGLPDADIVASDRGWHWRCASE